MGMSKRTRVQPVKTYAQLRADFDAAEALGDVATAAGIYRQFAGSVHYGQLTERMHRMWGLPC